MIAAPVAGESDVGARTAEGGSATQPPRAAVVPMPASPGQAEGDGSTSGKAAAATPGAAAERWWPPAPQVPRGPRWRGLPLAHRVAAWQLRREAAVRAAHAHPAAEVPAADTLDAVRDACRRAAARGDAVAQTLARSQALPWLAAACERVLGQRPDPEVLAAAWHLGEGHAVALADTAARRLALTLAAVTAAWSGRPCHVVCAGEEQVPLLVEALHPLLDHCGVTLASATAQTPPTELVAAYRADVLVATARRLVTDHCRDLRLRRGVESRLRWDLRQAVGTPSRLLTRGLHTALLDDLDAVLADDALTPVLMAVADEGSAFPQAVRLTGAWAATLAPGVDYRLAGAGGTPLTPAGERRLADWLPALPPLWRSATRAQELLAQALFVRHGLQRERDYVLRAEGIDFIAEGLHERLPLGVGWHGLSQAVEAAEGREPTAPARTVERTSVQTFFNRYHHLAGAAPCLDGLEAELWRCHGLPTWHGERAARPPQRRLWLARPADAQLLLEDAARSALAVDHAVLVVVRTAAQAAGWAAWQANPRVVVGLWPGGLPAALAQLSRMPSGLAGISVLLQEPLDSARAEAALAHRAAGAVDALRARAGPPAIGAVPMSGATPAHEISRASRSAVTVVRAASGNARVLREQLRPLAATFGALRPALPLLLRAAQRLAERGARRRRHVLAQREAQVGRQLSFSGTSRHTAAASVPPPPPSVRPTSVEETAHVPAPPASAVAAIADA